MGDSIAKAANRYVLLLLALLSCNSNAAFIRWDINKLLTTPGAIETTETGEFKAIQSGDKFDVVTEIAAINSSTPLIKVEDLGNAAAGIIKGALSRNTLSLLETGKNFASSVFVNWAKREDSSSITTDIFLTVKAIDPSKERIRSVKLNGGGVFLAETGRSDKSHAKVEGSLTFGDKRKELTFIPDAFAGTQDAILAKDFAVVEFVINLDQLVDETSLKLSLTFNAFEDNTGLFNPDLFSSAIFKSFDVTAFSREIPEPSIVLLIMMGLVTGALFRSMNGPAKCVLPCWTRVVS